MGARTSRKTVHVSAPTAATPAGRPKSQEAGQGEQPSRLTTTWSLWSKERGYADEAECGGAGGGIRMQVMSDVHTEFLRGSAYRAMLEMPMTAPILCLVGDIGVLGDEEAAAKYREFLLAQAERYQQVFVVSGNHEYYSTTVPQADAMIDAICAEADNLYYLQCRTFLLPGTDVRLIGATLWSDIDAEHGEAMQGMINDYNYIRVREPRAKQDDDDDNDDDNDNDDDTGSAKYRQLRVHDTNALHRQHRDWMQGEIAKAKQRGERVVLLSHHAPTMDANHPDEAEFIWAMCSNLQAMMRPPVVYWIFGHTHWCYRRRFFQTQCVANCKGYPFERTDWDVGFRIELPQTESQ